MNVFFPKYSGRIAIDHPLHRVLGAREAEPEASALTPGYPKYLHIPTVGRVPQWAEPANSDVTGYRPEFDCEGNFMSHRHQLNNNCYNYACNMATNTFAQPGRCHRKPWMFHKKMTLPDDLIRAAKSDGLQQIGGPTTKLAQVLKSQIYLAGRQAGGHLVALLVSREKKKSCWDGDFHWVRCDHPAGRKWSQKGGEDSVTDRDFAGQEITDPSNACWKTTTFLRCKHPRSKKHTRTEELIEYSFAAWMFVRYDKVSII